MVWEGEFSHWYNLFGMIVIIVLVFIFGGILVSLIEEKINNRRSKE